MTHQELENLSSDYLEGQLEPALRAQIEEHLAGCADCQALVGDVRAALKLCHESGDVLPPPWLVPKIRLATVGAAEPRATWRLAEWFRAVLNPRVVYAVAMAVFSLSIVLNAAGLNLRKFNVATLDPRTWVYNATRAGHLMVARAEKFYYDLRFVYEIQSRFRELESQPPASPAKPGAKPGGATNTQSFFDPEFAWAVAPATAGWNSAPVPADGSKAGTSALSQFSGREPGRSTKP